MLLWEVLLQLVVLVVRKAIFCSNVREAVKEKLRGFGACRASSMTLNDSKDKFMSSSKSTRVFRRCAYVLWALPVSCAHISNNSLSKSLLFEENCAKFSWFKQKLSSRITSRTVIKLTHLYQ